MFSRKRSDSIISRSTEIRVISGDDGTFESLWNEFCSANKAPVSYSFKWLDFCKKILRENFIKDLSFLVAEGGKALSIVPLIMEKGSFGKQFSVRNGYLLRAPVFASGIANRLKKKIEKTIFMQIEELAEKEDVCLHRTLIDPLCIIDDNRHYNYLLKFNYLNTSILTSIIDLQIPRDILWANLRKSYKPLINGEMKKYETVILDSGNISEESFSEFKELYRLASGRHVYNDSEWSVLYGMIKADEGMLILAKLDKKAIGGCYFNHLYGKAYYSFSANHPQCEKKYFIGHLVIWRAVEYYMEKNFKFLELGWQFYRGQLLEEPTDKEVDITSFKNGFGGFSFPLYRGIRFFNNEVRKKWLNLNLKLD